MAKPTGEVKAWPKPTGVPKPRPGRIRRPCDYGLELAAINCEVQLGTIEAYNRLCEEAEKMAARIKSGDVKAQNPLFAISLKGGKPSNG